MSSYLAFLHSGIETASENAFEDGAQLANDCITQLNKLEDRDQFPPSLLILLASPAYLDLPKAEQLLQGINQPFTEAGFDDVPLIGSSVAAVFFDRRVYEKGALLVCIASRLIEAQVAIGANARKAPEDAIKSLLHDLVLASEEDEEDRDPNPRADRTLLTFFPGFGEAGAVPAYPAPNLHRNLRKGTRARIRIVGGVSSASANDPHRATPGLQFANKQLIKDAVVAALITCGAPMGISLGRGLSPTGRILQVKRLSEDGRAILEFDQGSAVDIIQQEDSPVFLGEMSSSVTSDEPAITAPRIAPDGRSVQVLREIKQNAFFEVLKPEPEKLINAAIESIKMARGGILIRNPVTTSLMLPCNIWNPHFNSLGLNFEHGLARIEEETGIPCVGGFVDGEAGVDETARSLFSNGGVVGIVFGDELRERTPLYRGFDALANHGDRLAGPSSIANRTGKEKKYDIVKVIEDAIDATLRIIVDTGFPGAMLHLLMPYEEQVVEDDQEKKFIVARQCKGARFEKMKEMMIATPIRLPDDDILAIVAREEKSKFIGDSRKNPHCDPEFVKESGIISQYIMPLSRLKKDVLGVIQIDLGNVEFLRPSVEQVLKSLEKILTASLNRLFNLVEVNIARDLDQALNDSLSAETIEEATQILIKKAFAALNLDAGHLRLADLENQRLLLVAGVGQYYAAAKETRKAIDLNELSITCHAFRQASLNKGTYIFVDNDVEDYNDYRNRLERHKEEFPAMYAALKQMRSFVAMVFGNEEKGEKLGVFLFSAKESWFFTPSHVRAIDALGQRLGFLVEHFKRKRGEEEARKRLQFLSDSSPQFARLQNLDDPGGFLTDVTKQFSVAAGAEKAALYLWDKFQEQYILRAQYKLSDPRWVNAARHGVGDYWTGTAAATGIPQYIPNLYEYFQNNPDLRIKGRYNVQIWGKELSPNFTVESIGLPLLVAGEPLGVLALYREIVPGQPSGFVTTDTDLLQKSADRLAGLISFLLSHRTERWYDKERIRRQDVHEATVNRKNFPEGEQEEDFEVRVCKQALISYHAIEAVFYKYDPDRQVVASVCGFCRPPGTKNVTGFLPSNDIPPIVSQTALDYRAGKNKVSVEFRHLYEEDWKDPEKVATQNLVNRVCLPLIGEEHLIGLLDLKWRVDHRHAFSLSYHHDEQLLLDLGNVIGSAYLRHRLAEEKRAEMEAKQRALAVEAMAAMVAQSGHRFKNHLVTLDRLALEIKETTGEAEKGRAIDSLVKATSEGSKMINRPIRAAERTLNLVHESCHLHSLIIQAIEEVVKDEFREIDVTPPEYSNLHVMVDPDNVREAFANLLSNAVKSLKEKNGGYLKINISPFENNHAQVVFEDTGIGMTEDEIKDALSGFVNTQSSGGVGVLLSRVLLEAQGGGLKFESEKGSWTKAIVTLPMTK